MKKKYDVTLINKILYTNRKFSIKNNKILYFKKNVCDTKTFTMNFYNYLLLNNLYSSF